MIIDESIRFAIGEYLYRNNITKKELAHSIGVHEAFIERWLNGSVGTIRPEVWIPLFPYVEPYIKNLEVFESTKDDLREYNDLKNKVKDLKKIISGMSYEDACEKLVKSLKFISQKYRLNINILSFSDDLYKDIIGGIITPSVEQVKELCKAWSLNLKTSRILLELADRANSEAVSELADIICGKTTAKQVRGDFAEEENTLNFVSDITESKRDDRTVSFE